MIKRLLVWMGRRMIRLNYVRHVSRYKSLEKANAHIADLELINHDLAYQNQLLRDRINHLALRQILKKVRNP